jgi:uncharacterized UBP type Zn finger protein
MALVSVGFPEVRVKKAMFWSAGQMQEATNWLIAHQHEDSVDLPWTMAQLQVNRWMVKNNIPFLDFFSSFDRGIVDSI